MASVDILVPQMGEGLTEVRILEFQKKPGDFVKRDELLYSMETDKATMEVESPQDGRLTEWLAKEGDVLAVGAQIARFEIISAETGTDSESVSGSDLAQTNNRAELTDSRKPAAIIIPPRTRAYCRELGLNESEMLSISAPSGKLMPADIDAYLALRNQEASPRSEIPAVKPIPKYTEKPLSPQQRTFIYRIKRSAQIVVPGTIMRPIVWNRIRHCVQMIREHDSEFRPTEFQTFAYCVAEAIRQHPKFRSTLPNEETIREYPHVNLGIAVARTNGELALAVVPDADRLEFDEFIRAAQKNIRLARESEDQAGSDTQFHLTYLGAQGIRDAVPVLVSPAVAVMFIGATYEEQGETFANIALTFDHRLINGMEAALFLESVAKRAEDVFEEDVEPELAFD